MANRETIIQITNRLKTAIAAKDGETASAVILELHAIDPTAANKLTNDLIKLGLRRAASR